MDVTKEIRHWLERLDSEHGLQILILLVAAYMFVEARAWGRDSSIFPQMMAGAVIVGTLLLLFQDHLPSPVRKLVSGEASAFKRTESEFEEKLDQSIEAPETEPTDYDRPLNPVVFTAVLISVYAVAGYLFSLLVASPLFAAAYLLWFKKPWPLVLLVAVVAGVIAWAFAKVIVVPVDRGILVGDLLYVVVM